MNVAVLPLAIALVTVIAVLAALGPGKLARMDGASYPTALTRAAVAFAAVITLASAAAGAFPALLDSVRPAEVPVAGPGGGEARGQAPVRPESSPRSGSRC
ncbi:hypothetical protein GCM10010103_55740 [Streptomyces paradoxus]